jgi:hypothetical protein
VYTPPFRSGKAGVLAADASNSVRDDASGVARNSVHCVKALIAISDEGFQRGQLASADESTAGIGRYGLPGECVEHGCGSVVGGMRIRIELTVTLVPCPLPRWRCVDKKVCIRKIKIKYE